MRKITLFVATLSCTILLTACGGGGTNTASVTPTPTNPTIPAPSEEGKLVIDNGRGTSNNQDTERPK